MARVGRVLGQILHTSDAAYAQVVRLRLGEIARQMREGLVTVNCTSLPASAIGRPTGSRAGGRPAAPGARRDSLAGGVITGGTTSERTAVGIAGLGMAGGHPAATAETLINEYAHAVLPAVGVRHRERTGPVEVHDWAYHHERAFAVLTPEEALDNADTYGQLAEALATGSELMLAADDDYGGSASGADAPVRRALALAEQRIRLTRGFLLELAGPGAPAANVELAQRHLGAGEPARLTTFASALGTVYEGIHGQLSVRFASAGVRGALAWSSTATVTADGVVAGGRGAGGVNVGSAFLGLDPEQQIRVLEQLLVANHPELRDQAPALAALSAELAGGAADARGPRGGRPPERGGDPGAGGTAPHHGPRAVARAAAPRRRHGAVRGGERPERRGARRARVRSGPARRAASRAAADVAPRRADAASLRVEPPGARPRTRPSAARPQRRPRPDDAAVRSRALRAAGAAGGGRGPAAGEPHPRRDPGLAARPAAPSAAPP